MRKNKKRANLDELMLCVSKISTLHFIQNLVVLHKELIFKPFISLWYY